MKNWKQGQLTDIQKRMQEHDERLLIGHETGSFRKDFEWFNANRSKLQGKFHRRPKPRPSRGSQPG